MKLKRMIPIVFIALAALAAVPTVCDQNTLPFQAEEPIAASTPEAAPEAVPAIREKAFTFQPDPLRETAITQAQRDAAAEHITFTQEEPAPTGQASTGQTSTGQVSTGQAAVGQPVQNQTTAAKPLLLFPITEETDETENADQKTTSSPSTQKTTLKVDDYSQSYMGSVYYQRLKAVTLTGDYRSDLLAVAESQLGYRESSNKSQLDGSGSGSGDCTEYGRFCGTNGTAWCSEFATWCARQAGIPTSVLGNSTSARADRFGGSYHPWSDTVYAGGSFQPRPGDLAFFAWSESSLTAAVKDHTAIFVSADWSSDSLVIYTLDGNSGGQVQRNTQRVQNQGTGKISGGWIAGFIAPNYGDGNGMIQGTVTAPTPAKPVIPPTVETEPPAEEPIEDTVKVPEENVDEQFSDDPDNTDDEQPTEFPDEDPAEGSAEDTEKQLQEAPDEPSDDQLDEPISDAPVEGIASQEASCQQELLGEAAQTA